MVTQDGARSRRAQRRDAAEAPFVQVPCHVNIRDGAIALTNNDHTILGLRASTYLMPYLPEKYRLLPLLQSVWYIPAGLDIWNSCSAIPGRYATMKGMQVRRRPTARPCGRKTSSDREPGTSRNGCIRIWSRPSRRLAALLWAVPRVGRRR